MSQAKGLNLALQGGGAHGAFTWGVLDYLLESPLVYIEGISGTSAGAMNAVIAADGLLEGSEDKARDALNGFWHSISRAAMLSPIRRTPLDMWMGNWSLDYSPGYLGFDLLSRFFSPYQLNPLDINPLRDLLEAHVDFERVRQCPYLKLFVSATNVRSGKQRTFRREEMSCDAVMASACLPFIYKAVEIDGEAYWDGGYMGNPSIFPLMEECDSRDIVLVHINPVYRDKVPRTAAEISNRLNEITFNAPLIKEIRSVAMLKNLIDDRDLNIRCYRDTHLHRIDGQHILDNLSISSKLNAEWAFLQRLKERGREAAERWLKENLEAVGDRSTLDIDDVYL